MKRKHSNILENIPNKKFRKDKLKELEKLRNFNIDKYIEEHIKEYTESFIKTSKEEFAALDQLTSDFLKYLEKDNQYKPFTYSIMGSPYQLSELNKKVIDIFKLELEYKGYSVCVIKEVSSRYTSYSITVDQ